MCVMNDASKCEAGKKERDILPAVMESFGSEGRKAGDYLYLRRIKKGKDVMQSQGNGEPLTACSGAGDIYRQCRLFL